MTKTPGELGLYHLERGNGADLLVTDQAALVNIAAYSGEMPSARKSISRISRRS